MMYKSLHGMTPYYLSSRFVFRNDITSYRLGNTESKLALPQPRTPLTAVPGCGTAYPVTRVQQHLYMILNSTTVTTVLNEF